MECLAELVSCNKRQDQPMLLRCACIRNTCSCGSVLLVSRCLKLPGSATSHHKVSELSNVSVEMLFLRFPKHSSHQYTRLLRMAKIKRWLRQLRSHGNGGFSPDQLLPKRLRPFVIGSQCTILNFALLTSIILSINLIFTIVFIARRGWSGGLGILYEGDCAKVNRLNTIAHLVINAMSAILLAGGNFCMQCVAAPNRKQIDAAHEKRGSLDVGIPSLTNIFCTNRKRRIPWLILGCSSLPLHLW